MIRDRIINILKSGFPFQLSNDQLKAIEIISDFITDKRTDSLMIIKGYAGTGKTTLVSGIIKVTESVKMKAVLLAPTGRAAKVLANYSGRSAFTIHKKIYRQRSSKDAFGEFVIDRNMHKDTIFIIDESSMLSNKMNDASIFGSGNLMEDLFTYVLNGKGCRLIFIGDEAQLPPVGFIESPALQPGELREYSRKIYITELKDVIRQNESSGVLINATHIRNNIQKINGSLPAFRIKDYPDIELIDGAELVDKISECYDKHGIDETIIITRSNKRANKYNEGIRRTVLWREEELSAGDHLMVVKNNYFWISEDDNYDTDFIANGDTAEIVKIHKYEEIYEFRFADVTLRFNDYSIEIRTKIILDTLYVEAPSLSAEDNRKLFYNILEDYSNIKGKRNQYTKVKENEFFNALQVKFAYAVTCHKAQGGQWKAVFIDQGYLVKDMINIDYLRWLYTAFTRTTDKLYLVNFSGKLFDFK